MGTIYLLHHVDLDGMGVKLLGVNYARQKGCVCHAYSCGYNGINPTTQAVLKQDNIEEILIGDISVNEETAQMLEHAYRKGVKVRLFDHHETALFLNSYEWATVLQEDNNGIAHSGTWVMGQDSDFQPIYQANQLVMDTIDDWDTWNWKQKDNRTALQLNSLMEILGEAEFFHYLTQHQSAKSVDELFDEKSKIMLEVHRREVVKLVETCEKHMHTLNLWTTVPNINKSICLKTGMVFVQSHVSEVGDLLLDRNPQLDVLMMIIFPNTISWRTQKQLPISLGRVAQRATGHGGGHPKAAGSGISYSVFQDTIDFFMEHSFSDNLEYSNLLSPAIRRLREAEAPKDNPMPSGELIPF